MSTSPEESAAGGLELHSPDEDVFSPKEDWFARACRMISGLFVIGLVIMMGAEMIARSVFHWSIQISNEVGGYGLVAITFLTLASGQLSHAYHRVHFVENKMGRAGRARLRLVFDIASLIVTVVLLAEFIRFELITGNSGDVAATTLMTPMWVPRFVMPLGLLALTWALLRVVVADWRRVRAASIKE